MLKLIYTNDTLSIEYIETTCEEWINGRVTLALRTGFDIHLEHTTASFLIPCDLSAKVAKLAMLVENNQNIVDICRCDEDFVEVTLKGIWLSSQVGEEAGVFVTSLNTSAEVLIHNLHRSQSFSQISA
jgi:hypothetical protein